VGALLPRHALREKFEIYLNAGERDLVREQARLAGLSLSSFVRRAALRQKLAPLPTDGAARWASLSRACSNLNQIARRLNAGTASGVDPAVIEAVAEEVQALRRELLGGADR
jgi:hypothetical protein